MVTINPRRIVGNWRSGIALDVHTTSSSYLGTNEAGHEVFETKRSERGDLLYRLKYRSDLTAARQIVATASAYLTPHRAKFGVIVPVPPSGTRAVQPVIALATGISQAIGLPLAQCVTPTRPTAELKGVMDPERRKELLKGLYTVDPAYTRGKNILLFDDLYRSGSTMNAIPDVLMQQGQAASVRVLTITHTRSNR